MKIVRLLALMALALGIPASAQVMRVQPIQVQRPVVAPVLTVPQSQPSEL